MELLEKRRMNRSNSDIAKESNLDSAQDGFKLHETTDSMPNIPIQNGGNASEPSVNGPIKTSVRNLISSSKINYSVSSDDNDNDERETDSRSSHPHHHGARRWRQISQEKQSLQQENKKVHVQHSFCLI